MDIPRYWRLRNQRYRLEGRVCKSCGAYSFPPRLVCKKCRSRDSQPYNLKGRGVLYSYTIIYQAPDRFDAHAPYAVGLIDLQEGVRITAQLTDIALDAIEIGMQLEMVVRQIYEDGVRGPIMYGYKFRPLFTFTLEQKTG